jgi:hypothetical protein
MKLPPKRAHNIITYLLWVLKTDTFPNNIKRWWKHFASPYAIVRYWILWFTLLFQEYKKVDRRKKMEGASNVWLINRDGDYFVPECPTCHTTHLCFVKEKSYFECYMCSQFVSIYLEDGIILALDHRRGNIPLPTYVVIDDNNKWHIGIEEEAPSWWQRREIYRDLHNGKDAHGHHYYLTGGITTLYDAPTSEQPQTTTAN